MFFKKSPDLTKTKNQKVVSTFMKTAFKNRLSYYTVKYIYLSRTMTICIEKI